MSDVDWSPVFVYLYKIREKNHLRTPSLHVITVGLIPVIQIPRGQPEANEIPEIQQKETKNWNRGGIRPHYRSPAGAVLGANNIQNMPFNVYCSPESDSAWTAGHFGVQHVKIGQILKKLETKNRNPAHKIDTVDWKFVVSSWSRFLRISQQNTPPNFTKLLPHQAKTGIYWFQWLFGLFRVI